MQFDPFHRCLSQACKWISTCLMWKKWPKLEKKEKGNKPVQRKFHKNGQRQNNYLFEPVLPWKGQSSIQLVYSSQTQTMKSIRRRALIFGIIFQHHENRTKQMPERGLIYEFTKLILNQDEIWFCQSCLANLSVRFKF